MDWEPTRRSRNIATRNYNAHEGDQAALLRAGHDGLGQVVDSLLRAGLALETLREYPYANGCRVNPALVQDGRRWVWPPGTARVPLMVGLSARRPA